MLWSLLEVWWWEEYHVVKSAGASVMGEVGCRGVCSSFGNKEVEFFGVCLKVGSGSCRML
jgi:hypothetical protein